MVQALGRLMELEGRFVSPTSVNRITAVDQEFTSAAEPPLEISFGLAVGLFKRHPLRPRERMVVRLVERDPVAHDVHEERPSLPELLVHVFDRVDDELRGRAELAGDLIGLQEFRVRLAPVLSQVGQLIGAHKDEEVVVGLVAADGIIDPVAAGIGAIEDDLQDPALSAGRDLGLRRFPELPEQNLEHPLQVTALGVRQMVQRRLHKSFVPLFARSLQGAAQGEEVRSGLRPKVRASASPA